MNYQEKRRINKNEDCYYYHTINSIRRVFEEFLSFKLKNNKLPQKSNQPEIEEVYRIMTQKEMSGRKTRLRCIFNKYKYIITSTL